MITPFCPVLRWLLARGFFLVSTHPAKAHIKYSEPTEDFISYGGLYVPGIGSTNWYKEPNIGRMQLTAINLS